MKQQASQRRGMSLQRGRSVVHLRLSSMHARRPRHSQQVRVKTFTFIFRIETLFSAFFHRKHSRDQCLIDFSTRCRSVRAVDVYFGSARVGCVTEFMVHQQRCAQMPARKLYDGAENCED